MTTVCIVGAGVAGLKTASELIEGGMLPSEITILEAQDRVGGRIKTVTSEGHTYDLGAAWFHDFLTNSVLHEHIADDTLLPQDGYFDDKQHLVYGEEGLLDARDLRLEQVRAEIEKYIELFYAGTDVGDMLLDAIVEEYHKKYGAFSTAEQKAYAGRVMRYLELWYGIPSHDISAKYAVMSHQGRNLYNRKGYGFLIDKLEKSIKGVHLRLNTPVRSIDRNRLHVLTAADTLEAKYVVVTVPQSILALDPADEHALVWSPPLPALMTEAISSVHYGALGKVILQFDSVFWPENEDRFEILASKLPKDPKHPLSFEYPVAIVNQIPISGATSLVCLIQSPVTDFLEANPEKAWEYLKPMISLLGKASEPRKVTVTDWTVNPYARGLYTAVHVDDDPANCLVHLSGDYDMCGLGAGSKIRFAGEHTIADGAGCVHGAYDSGIRAAKWILADRK